MLTLHPPAFIETGGCDGPRYTRGQPSRETPGVLMTEIQDKYTTEFELPYLNIKRYIGEVNNNWNRLDDNQKSLIRASFKSMGFSTGNKEKFTDGGNGGNSIDYDVINFVNYLTLNEKNAANFMEVIWNTTPDQKTQLGITNDQLGTIRNSMYQWSLQNLNAFHYNWKTGLVTFLFILIIILLIIAACSK